ncbi:alpha/beta fold hydrolase [Desulfohalovibrio reitneri]|uniref:alpha/beta fold hydrolase n=1 Tax=Desulfohalovibrio reitneri TaxID=1307759 RepID=UPI0004A6BC91|nr:alpha/beta hydrolase [Desulfohalovibrio reitneri]
MKYLDVQGERIAYEEIGSGPPLVFISGWGGAAAEWRGDMEYFGRFMRCLAPEHPGVAGQPLPDGPFSTRDMAGRIARLLDGLGIGSAAVAGLSMGGAVAQELALMRPDLVDRLVLCGTFARLDARAARGIEGCARLIGTCGLKASLDMIYWLAFGPTFYDKNLNALDDAREAFLRDPLPAGVFAYQAQACLDHDTLDRLGGIACPALVLHGGEDILLRPRLGRELAQALPHARFSLMEDGGHLCVWERPDHFRDEVDAFLAE